MNENITLMGKPDRQGDVYLLPIAAIPAGVTPVKPRGGRIVLADGEVTGHAHAIRCTRGVSLYELIEEGDVAEMRTRFLRVEQEEGVDVVHEQHGTIHLDEGLYAVVGQRVYTPGEIQRVTD